jgi:succinate dehydrogenase / fumarate reductase cytochrome b subunit
MKEVFSVTWVVVIYVLAMFSLAYHLMHGFQSAFQTLGLNHKKYTPAIKAIGFWFSIIVSFIFAMMPIAIFMGWIA